MIEICPVDRKPKERREPDMLERFYPHNYIKSAYQIEYGKLHNSGFKGIIFDIDNTLVEHGAPADQRCMDLLARLKEMGYRIVLLSNNKEPRVRLFNDMVKVQYIFKAGKPYVKNYLKAMEMMGTDKGNTLFVGDQLFTDIWGAKKAGMYTFLVQPINKKEEIQIVLKRYLERIVLTFYKRKCKRENKPFLQGN